jgi:hypothetical protein
VRITVSNRDLSTLYTSLQCGHGAASAWGRSWSGLRFAPARGEAFKRAKEPDRLPVSPATTRGIRFLSRRWARGWRQPRFLLTDLSLSQPSSPTTITADRGIAESPAREALSRIRSSVSRRRGNAVWHPVRVGTVRGLWVQRTMRRLAGQPSREVGDRTERTRRCRDYRGATTFPMRRERCRVDLGARSLIRDGGRGKAAAGGVGIAGMSRPRSAPQRRHENRLLVKGIRVR